MLDRPGEHATMLGPRCKAGNPHRVHCGHTFYVETENHPEKTTEKHLWRPLGIPYFREVLLKTVLRGGPTGAL